jgi:hypothetical protein
VTDQNTERRADLEEVSGVVRTKCELVLVGTRVIEFGIGTPSFVGWLQQRRNVLFPFEKSINRLGGRLPFGSLGVWWLISENPK